MNLKHTELYQLPILVVGLLALTATIYLGGLGRLPLFGRDEALYAEAAREMLVARDWITPTVNSEPFFEKPPLYYWLAGSAFKVLGVSPLAARLPAALSAISIVLLTLLVARNVWGARAGFLAGLSLATCLQLAIIGRMGIMDGPLTLLIFASLILYIRWRKTAGPLEAAGFGVLLGLAILLKGLAGALAPAIAFIHALLFHRQDLRRIPSSIAIAVMACCAVAAPWLIAIFIRHGADYYSILFVREHFIRMVRPMQDHGGPIFYYFILIGVSFFPWVAFLPAAFLRSESFETTRGLWWSLAVVWIIVVLIPFSLIRTKLPGYVMPLFPAMAILAGVELDRQLSIPRRRAWIGAVVGACTLGVLFALLPVAGMKIGERVDAAQDAWKLVVPTSFWVGGYIAMALGAWQGIREPMRGLSMLAVGQIITLGALLIGVLPVLSPYLGGSATHLVSIAKQELPERRVVLFAARPEAVAFELRQSVPVYSRRQQSELLGLLHEEEVALIAPVTQKDFLSTLPYRRKWRSGAEVLLETLQVDYSDVSDRRDLTVPDSLVE